MKIKISILVSVLISFLSLTANHLCAQNFKAGFTAGLIATDVYGADKQDRDNDFHKAGFIAGGKAELPLNAKNSLQVEINYVQKGTQQLPDSNGNNYYKFSFNYVEIPILYKHRISFNIGKKPVAGFDLHAGLSFAQMVKGAVSGQYYSSDLDMSYINKTDISVLVGFDYNFTQHVNLCFRYSNSVIPVFKRTPVSPYYFLSTFNNGNNLVLHFMLQFMFGKDKNAIPVLAPIEENVN